MRRESYLWTLSWPDQGQDRLVDRGRVHGWAMLALSVEQIKPRTSKWLGHGCTESQNGSKGQGCSELRTDQASIAEVLQATEGFVKAV